MNRYLKISDYFKRNMSYKSARDWMEIVKIRNKINSFEDEADIYKWIYERRQSTYYKSEDERLFEIPMDMEVDRNWIHRRNEFYQQMEEGFNPYAHSKWDRPAFSYIKRDRNGNLKTDKYGEIKQYGKIGRGFINLANNSLNSKWLDRAFFIAKNWKAILISCIVALISILLCILLIYAGGILNSIGPSPFVLCGDDEITGKSTVQIPNADVSEMSTPEYAMQAFIAVAKQRNWRDEAIVGTLSYIMQEGTGMGTFTYEGYYTWKGPSGVKFDKSLDNEKWLSWLATDGKEQAHNGYYSRQTNRYAAIGLGLLQNSDVWAADGSMEAAGATALINYAQSKGKPWQDPVTQMEYYFDYIFTKPTAFDTTGIDPTRDNFTAEEWARRVTAGIGMPAMSYTDQNSYMSDHIRHIDNAALLFKNFTGVDLGSLDQQSVNPCKGAKSAISGGNATIADAAVSLAAGDKPSDKIRWDRDGLDSANLNDARLITYKSKHMEILPNDIHFASCDRAAYLAIKWSGADETFPVGPTLTQYNYLKSSSKWSYVGDYGDASLKPGDVLITKGDGHIKIYVGVENANKRFPGSNADTFDASFQEYFPVLYKDSPGYDTRLYAVFRNVKSDKGVD